MNHYYNLLMLLKFEEFDVYPHMAIYVQATDKRPRLYVMVYTIEKEVRVHHGNTYFSSRLVYNTSNKPEYALYRDLKKLIKMYESVS